jgi:nucleoside-triphosphatase THEP1
MILVALTGPIGSGKTTLLEKLAAEMSSRDRIVDGFVAVAHDRVEAFRGAGSYRLRWIASGEEETFAERQESFNPPYRFSEPALQHASVWAQGLLARPPLSLLILDEFGPVEAGGGGHIRYWKSIVEARPGVVVIAVRDALLQRIQAGIGTPFDLVVDAASPDALAKLTAVVDQHPDWIRAGQFGATAGGFEATVGSALHAASVPLRGLFLSTMQSLIMMYSGDRMRMRRRVVWVPFISAGLKALSPSGSRLRPMLAITMQGILFSAATVLFGWNIFGVGAGGWLVGAWAASQGVLLQYLFIGSDYFRVIDNIIQWIAARLHFELPGITVLLLFWVCAWGTVSSGTTIVAWLRRHRLPRRVAMMLARGAAGIEWGEGKTSYVSAMKTGVRDLLRPMFWFPIIVVAVIVGVTGSTLEQAMWILVRAITIGWVVFSVVRMVDPKKFVAWLSRRGYWGPAMAFNRAFRRKNESPTPER